MSWLQRITHILNADPPTLKNLAESVGADPRVFYVNQDLSRCNLRGEDLSGMDLTGTRISPRQLNKRSIIDPEFDPRKATLKTKRYFELNREVEAMLRDHSRSLNYRYDAWTAKRLVYQSYTFHLGRAQDFAAALQALKQNESLNRLITARSGPRFAHRITIDNQAHAFIRALGKNFAGQGVGYTAAIVLGLLIEYRVPWSKIDNIIKLEFDRGS